MDGSIKYPVDIFHGKDLCVEKGFKPKNIIIDVILEIGQTLGQVDPSKFNTIQNTARYMSTTAYDTLMQDIDASTDVGGNLDHPMGTLLYTVSCMHCMTVSLAEGGQGLGAMWGVELARERLEAAGFSSISVERLPHDIQNAYFLVQK